MLVDLSKSIERIEAELTIARDEERKAESAYLNAYKKFNRRRRKRAALEHLLYERQQGQLPLLEHEAIA